jgi:hypothetical protein
VHTVATHFIRAKPRGSGWRKKHRTNPSDSNAECVIWRFPKANIVTSAAEDHCPAGRAVQANTVRGQTSHLRPASE